MEPDMESQRTEKVRIHNILSGNGYMSIFFSIILITWIVKGNKMFLLAAVPLLVLSLWDLWKSGSLKEYICPELFVIILNIGMFTYFACEGIFTYILKERQLIIIIYGIAYGPFIIADFIKFIKELRGRS